MTADPKAREIARIEQSLETIDVESQDDLHAYIFAYGAARYAAGLEAGEGKDAGWRQIAITGLERIVAMVQPGSAIATEAHVALIALKPVRALIKENPDAEE